MNIFFFLAIGIIFYFLAYRYYSRYIAHVFDENDGNPTPAQQLEDGRDFVPTSAGVLFSHQFASIAGAGPIVGPTTALLFGFIPVWMWVILGAVFVGAVHDYTAMFTSLRERGASMAEVARSTMGKWGFFLIISFTILMLFFLTAAFLGLTATSLTSLVPIEEMRVSGHSFLKTVVNAEGVAMAQIGGIASTSVIILTLTAPLLGWLMRRKKISGWLLGGTALLLSLASIAAGIYLPVSLDPKVWIVIITIYVVIASTAPVWLILQPRDFVNSFVLYIGMAILLIGIIGGGLTGMSVQAPAFTSAETSAKLGMLWPFLFITVACGAISGFHSIVAAGTVSKQIARESDARKIAFGGMLLEGVLALAVIITLATGLSFPQYLAIVWPETGAANPILAFALSMGYLLHNALGVPVAFGTVFGILMVESFVVTTLDTAIRLNRYLLQELWKIILPNARGLLQSPMLNSLLCAAVMIGLAWTNAFQLIWPIFGASNQLMAALALIVVTLWLMARKKPNLFTLIPAIFMIVTSMAALYFLLVNKYLPAANYPLIITDLILMALAVGVVILAVKRFRSLRQA